MFHKSNMMNAIIKLSLVTCIVGTCCAIKVDKGEVCSKRSMVILDAKLSRLMPIGNSGRKLPENREEGRKFCE